MKCGIAAQSKFLYRVLYNYTKSADINMEKTQR